MKQKVVWAFVGGLVVIVALAVTRGQLVSIAASVVRQTFYAVETDVFDTNRIHDLELKEPFTVLAAGDIANCDTEGSMNRAFRNLSYSLNIARSKLNPNDGMVATTKLLSNQPDAIVLALGDLAYKRGEPAAFNDCYDPYWGSAKARTWPTPGNHEYKSPGAYGYYDYWQERAGPDRAGYYGLVTENWLILSLNSEIDASPGSSQATWLKGIISAYPYACIAAYYHKPAYSTAPRKDSDNARALFGILADSNATLVLNGHNHFYERSKPLDASGTPSKDGTVIFISGAGGEILVDQVEPAAFADRLITNIPGILKLDFSSTGVRWSYLTSEGSTESDSGALSCQKGLQPYTAR